MSDTLLITAAEMQTAFYTILLKLGFSEEKATECATVFTNNSVDGLYTHGVNRFPRFVEYVKKGYVKADAIPTLKHSFGAIEQWDGNLGPGPLNAIHATERAMELSQQNGMGCVTLANTNHWMRGGYYGWHAAKKGFAFIGWTNTIANMPAWNALDKRLGNNPMVLATPFEEEAIVLDMAVSQFSFGTLEQAQMRQEELPVYGGFDKDGKFSKDPSAIIASQRVLPVGYWKGAGLSLLLDVLATILSGGLSTYELSKENIEHGLSQVFICFDLSKLHHHTSIPILLKQIIDDYHQSQTEGNKPVTYPGEGTLKRRRLNEKNGIPVLKKVWEEIQAL